MSSILSYNDMRPTIHDTCLIADGVRIIGDVEIGENTSIWYNCVLRGDVNMIRIGTDTNIQDGTVIHVATHGKGTHIGSRVTVGHAALLHDCTLQDDAFVGMQACVMDGAIVESRAMLAAGALLTPGKTVPSGELWAGRPARFVRQLTPDDFKLIDWSWPHYVKLGQNHKQSTPV